MEATRVDRWVWAIRLYKTRGDATDACRGGHVKVNGKAAKPATPVAVGSRVEARVHGRDRIVEVTQVIDKRVGAAVAVGCYIDHTPPEPEADRTRVAERERGAGRPTKRERRQIDRFRTRFVNQAGGEFRAADTSDFRGGSDVFVNEAGGTLRAASDVTDSEKTRFVDLERFENAGLRIVAAKMKHLSRKEAEGFYAVHRERPFFRDLVDFMVSGPVLVQVLEGENAIAKNRELMGATDPKKAAKGTIRADFAESIDANAVHGSDGPDTARTEISYFFPAFEVFSR